MKLNGNRCSEFIYFEEDVFSDIKCNGCIPKSYKQNEPKFV